MSTRDELAELVQKSAAQTPADWLYDGEAQHVADAILAAGYRKPRTITTVEELNALPVESVVRTDFGVVWEKDQYSGEPDFPWWASPGDSRQYPAGRIAFPATVLFEPEAQA